MVKIDRTVISILFRPVVRFTILFLVSILLRRCGQLKSVFRFSEADDDGGMRELEIDGNRGGSGMCSGGGEESVWQVDFTLLLTRESKY